MHEEHEIFKVREALGLSRHALTPDVLSEIQRLRAIAGANQATGSTETPAPGADSQELWDRAFARAKTRTEEAGADG